MMSLALLNQKVTDPVLKKHIASIESSAHRGSDIVGQVLLFARGSEKEYAPQQLERIIGEITSIIKQTFPRNIEIVTDIGRDLYSIRGDATQLHQVLMNLCVNARDAMPAGGRLAITALNRFVSAADATLQFGGPPGDYVGLKISDTGTGMPKVIQERIFEPFFTTKEIGKGTGLGLSTVYAIVKNHKGFISLTSEEGEGTCFSVFIPAGQQSSDIRPATVEAAPQGGCGETILVVDDEEAVLEITREILELSGYTVLTARNGAEALSIFVAAGEGSIKLVVTDVNMPGMDGPTVVETIRKLMPSVKAIIVSGLISDWEPAKKTGVQIEGYLMKPYTSERLLAMIHEVLTRKSA
jgi:CheY-like chemotaxis protein